MTLSEISVSFFRVYNFPATVCKLLVKNNVRKVFSRNFPWGLHVIDDISGKMKNKYRTPLNDLNDSVLKVKIK